MVLTMGDRMWEAGADWRLDAACAGSDPDLFFPVGEDAPTIAAAKEVCAACPVREACLDYALETRQGEGVWGGLTATERRRLRRRLREAERRKAG